MEVTYKVEMTSTALADITRLDKKVAQRVMSKIRWLAENIDVVQRSALTAELRRLFKLRTGSYRIIYSVNHQDKIITIHSIGHRRDIYK